MQDSTTKTARGGRLPTFGPDTVVTRKFDNANRQQVVTWFGVAPVAGGVVA